MRFVLGALIALVAGFRAEAARELPPAESQACELLSAAEAAAAVGAGAAAGDAEAPDNLVFCAWRAGNAQLVLTLLDGAALGGFYPANYYAEARRIEAAHGAADLAGIGDAAFLTTGADGVPTVMALKNDWVAVFRGVNLDATRLAEAARRASARLPTVAHYRNQPGPPDSCQLLSVLDAAAALGHFAYFVTAGSGEADATCSFTSGGTAELAVLLRSPEGLGGQSPSDYYRRAKENEQVSRAVDDIEAGDRAFISPADPDGRYFYLMILKNGRIALLSGMGIGKDAAVAAAQAAASRM